MNDLFDWVARSHVSANGTGETETRQIRASVVPYLCVYPESQAKCLSPYLLRDLAKLSGETKRAGRSEKNCGVKLARG